MENSKVILDLVTDNKPLSDVLFRLKLLLSKFDDDSILSWVNNEITGYSNDSAVPEYRNIQGIIRCDIMQGFQYYQNVYLPISYSDSNILKIITLAFKESVAAIETITKNDDGKYVSILQNTVYPYLQKYVNGYIQNAQLVFSKHNFSDVYSSIKNKVLDILLLLETKIGNLDSYDIIISDNQKSEIIPTIIKIVYEDKSINIGSNNNISKSDIIGGEQSSD